MPTKITLKCHNFDGSLKDKFQFKSWLSQVETVIQSSPDISDQYKLVLLKHMLQV